MRAPASRISWMRPSWRGRSSTTAVTSCTRSPRALATRLRLSATGASRSTASTHSGPTAILSMYTHGPGLNIVSRPLIAITASALSRPSEQSVVPSTGSTAMSTGLWPGVPMRSPLYSIGASSFSPSPITTTPSIDIEFNTMRIASTAAPSTLFLSPRPIQRPAASAAASVTRTSSIARLRSGCCSTIQLPSFSRPDWVTNRRNLLVLPHVRFAHGPAGRSSLLAVVVGSRPLGGQQGD